MRLLNTRTLKLEDHPRVPEYAILSHRWGEEEVCFPDINGAHAPNLKGYSKIERCCAQALRDGHQYVWVDTCCIDKSSSAELSEAINSMYHWYREAQVCYAHLDDVCSDEDPSSEDSGFSLSEWFMRGWTLQELIAPETVIFFAKDWVEIGSKISLISTIAGITAVDEDVLLGTLPLKDVSVAKKMSWASWRETTRVEDRAYSLMGLFGVNMPLIYGEGKNAFARLQGEIMRKSTDQSIFAWTASGDSSGIATAFLASSPDDFRSSTSIDQILPADFAHLNPKSNFSLTQRGVQISLPIKKSSGDNTYGYLAILSCCSTKNRPLLLHLNRRGDGSYRRVDIDVLEEGKGPDAYSGFAVKDILISTEDHRVELKPFQAAVPLVRLRTLSVGEHGFSRTRYWPKRGTQHRDSEELMWELTSSVQKGIVHYHNAATGEWFLVIVGLSSSQRPCVHIQVASRADHLDREIERIVDSWSKFKCSARCPDWTSRLFEGGRKVSVMARKGGVLLRQGADGGHTRDRLQYVVTISMTRNLNSPATRSPSSLSIQPQTPPIGVYANDGRPVLFYVRARYNYLAATDEEFDFRMGDTIAVTVTGQDGWWHGELLDEARRQPGKHVFPSNYVALF